MPKDNWFLGETWLSKVVKNAPSPALAALQILAVGGTLLANWKPPVPQSKPKCKPSRQKAFSCLPPNLKLNWRILKVVKVSLNWIYCQFYFPWHPVCLICQKPSPSSAITSPFTSVKRAKKGSLSFPTHSQIRKGLIRPQNFISMLISGKTELDGPRNTSFVRLVLCNPSKGNAIHPQCVTGKDWTREQGGRSHAVSRIS